MKHDKEFVVRLIILSAYEIIIVNTNTVRTNPDMNNTFTNSLRMNSITAVFNTE